MERQIATVIASSEYKSKQTDKLKKNFLEGKIKEFRSQARKLVLDPARINTGMTSKERQRRFKTIFYNTIDSSTRTRFEEVYKLENDGRTIEEDGAFEEVLSLIEKAKRRKKRFK